MTERALDPPPTERYPLPIYLFLTGLLGWVTMGTLLAAPGGPAMLLASVLLGLLAVHLLLHWHSPRLANHDRPWMQYALAQGGLAVALTFATDNPSVWTVLFTWLVGEVVGMLKRPHLSALSLALYGVLAIAALFAITDRATALSWLGALLPSALFIALVVVLYKRQVEAREQAQLLVAEVEGANRQISAYAARVEALTLTNERQRMARELHDTLAQDVAGLVLQLEAANAHLDAGRPQQAQAIVQQAMARARATLRDARAAIEDLRAHEAQARLSERLASLCWRFQAESEVGCDLTVEVGLWDAALPTPQKEQLERIVSEALANVRTHARATRVTVQVRARAGTLMLRVADDGVGFDASQPPPAGHYGLHGLHERARLLGGTLHLQSGRGAGTTLTLAMPLAPLPAGHPHAAPAET